MGLMSLEHGARAHRADFALYGCAVLLMGGWLAASTPATQQLAVAATGLLGLAGWTLAEYLLHRFVLHGPQPFRGWHQAHHRRPQALIGTPTLASAAMFALGVFLPVLLLADRWRAGAFTMGMVAGYLVYGLAHHATHHGRSAAQAGWWRGGFDRRRRMHALHHRSSGVPCCFGVSSGFWDRVFGTLPSRSV